MMNHHTSPWFAIGEERGEAAAAGTGTSLLSLQSSFYDHGNSNFLTNSNDEGAENRLTAAADSNPTNNSNVGGTKTSEPESLLSSTASPSMHPFLNHLDSQQTESLTTHKSITPPPPTTGINKRREIAIFWDFENLPLPSWVTAAEASRAIVQSVSPYGRIVDRRLYFDMSSSSKNIKYNSNNNNSRNVVATSATMPNTGDTAGAGNHRNSNNSGGWSALDSSGFDLVNTPRHHMKETLDKKLIADVLTFAWDSAVRNDDCKPAVVLLTSDGDYAYTLSKLRDRGVLSIVMYGKDASVAQILKAAADIPLSFHNDVLATIRTAPATTDDDDDRNNNNHQSLQNDEKYGDKTDNVLTICKVLQEQQNQQSNKDGWLVGSKLAIAFRTVLLGGTSSKHNNNSSPTSTTTSLDKESIKIMYQKSRDNALATGWVERGRRYVGAGPLKDSIVVETRQELQAGNLSLEDFYRLTPAGWREVAVISPDSTPDATLTTAATSIINAEDAPSSYAGNTTRLFLKNVPRAMHITDLVQYLETEHHVEVLRAYTHKGPNNNLKAPFTFATVHLVTAADAERLMQAAKALKLIAQGRTMSAVYDTASAAASAKTESYIDPKHKYERTAFKAKSTLIGGTIASTQPNGETDPAELYCQAFATFIRHLVSSNSSSLHRDGWVDAGFWNQLKTTGNGGYSSGTNVSLMGGDKDRIRMARSSAITKQWIEPGRRVFQGEGLIEPGDRRIPTRHAPELYIRFTARGNELFQGGNSPSTAPSAVRTTPLLKKMNSRTSTSSSLPDDRHVFIKNLPSNTNVLELVEFLEMQYDLSIDKAMVEPGKRWDTHTQAHVQFSDARDARQMIQLTSRGSDRIIYKGKALEALRDQHVPKFDSDGDNSRHYVRDRIPDTISSVASVVSGISSTRETNRRIWESQSQVSVEESDIAMEIRSADVAEHSALMCRVIYDQSMGNSSGAPEPDKQTWCTSGQVADDFMKTINAKSTEERKQCYKNARHYCISENLIEMGRRIKASKEREIIVAPYFTGKPDPKLSHETYYRLTFKGVELAEQRPSLSERPSTNGSNKTAFLMNLPQSTQIKDLVKYLETTHGVYIRRALMQRTPKFVTAHVEFFSTSDFKTIGRVALQDRLIFGGRPLRARADKNVPNWVQFEQEKESDLFYQVGTSGSLYNDTAFSAGDTFSPYASVEEALHDDDCEITNLLFGDNFASLNKQCAEMTFSSLDTSFDVAGMNVGTFGGQQNDDIKFGQQQNDDINVHIGLP